MAAERTDYQGLAGFFNLREGAVEMKAALFGEEESPVLKKTHTIRPGALTYAVIWPQ